MELWILVILLLIEFLLAFTLSRGDFLNPTVIYSFVFFLASVDLSMMKSFWAVQLNDITVIVLCLGVFVFILSYNFIGIIGKKFNLKSRSQIVNRKSIEVNRTFCYILLFIYIVTIILAFRYVIATAKMYGGSGSVGQLIGIYNGLLKGATTDDVSYPFYIQILTDLCGLGSYVWGYIIVNNYVVTKKFNKMYVLFLLLGLIVCLESGSRGDAISVIFCIICISVLILRKSESAKRITRKFYSIFIVATVGVIISFQFFGTTMGRDSYIFTPFEYFSIYLGAPILNLNTMINRYGGYNTGYFNYTFSGLYSSIGGKLGISSLTAFEDPMVHLASNGHRTGNVATTYMAYYYDAGLFGVIILSAIMAIIMYKLYADAKKDKTSNVSYKTIIYAYFCFLLARSFFSNSLFNAIQLSLIKFILIIVLESKYINRIKIKIR